MNQVRLRHALAVLALILAECSCGDTYRPVAIPLPPIPPNPSSLHYVLTLSVNGLHNPGASTRIDVSGDSSVASAQVGLSPAHAVLLPGGSSVYVANQFEDTISFYAPSGTGPVSFVTLPAGSAPLFLMATTNNTVYVANSGSNTVSVITTANNAVAATIPAGINPVALAETPNGQKLYVANQGTGPNPVNGSVTSVNTVDNSVNPSIAGGVWASPVWAVARGDNARVYVLDQGTGVVSAIDTASDTVVGTASVQPGANYIVYEPSRNRLYVTNPVAATLTILDASSGSSSDPLTVLKSISLTGTLPSSVAALPDGSRVYVGSYSINQTTCTQPGDVAPCITAQVTVISGLNNTVIKTIPIALSAGTSTKTDTPTLAVCDSARFRLSMAASQDSSRVYAAYCDAGATAVIRTTPNTSPGSESSGDYLVTDLKAPVSAAPPIGNGQPPPQNPVFVLAGQ
jgi:YVTN family beta-propeller protein